MCPESTTSCTAFQASLAPRHKATRMSVRSAAPCSGGVGVPGPTPRTDVPREGRALRERHPRVGGHVRTPRLTTAAPSAPGTGHPAPGTPPRAAAGSPPRLSTRALRRGRPAALTPWRPRGAPSVGRTGGPRRRTWRAGAGAGAAGDCRMTGGGPERAEEVKEAEEADRCDQPGPAAPTRWDSALIRAGHPSGAAAPGRVRRGPRCPMPVKRYGCGGGDGFPPDPRW